MRLRSSEAQRRRGLDARPCLKLKPRQLEPLTMNQKVLLTQVPTAVIRMKLIKAMSRVERAATMIGNSQMTAIVTLSQDHRNPVMARGGTVLFFAQLNVSLA